MYNSTYAFSITEEDRGQKKNNPNEEEEIKKAYKQYQRRTQMKRAK